LMELSQKVDHARVVSIIRRADRLPLIDKYLLNVQRENLAAVNEAINELCVFEERPKALRDSIDRYDKFDQIALAQQLERHDLLEFRRIAAHLYKINKRWDKSLDLSKQDSLWADAMDTAAESRSQELAEELLIFFVANRQKECFGACLFVCYELLRPDVVMELAWRFGLHDFAVPFMIQSFRQSFEKQQSLTTRLEELEKQVKELDQKDKKTGPAGADQPADFHGMPGMPFAQMLPALPAPMGVPPFGVVPGVYGAFTAPVGSPR